MSRKVGIQLNCAIARSFPASSSPGSALNTPVISITSPITTKDGGHTPNTPEILNTIVSITGEKSGPLLSPSAFLPIGPKTADGGGNAGAASATGGRLGPPTMHKPFHPLATSSLAAVAHARAKATTDQSVLNTPADVMPSDELTLPVVSLADSTLPAVSVDDLSLASVSVADLTMTSVSLGDLGLPSHAKISNAVSTSSVGGQSLSACDLNVSSVDLNVSATSACVTWVSQPVHPSNKISVPPDCSSSLTSGAANSFMTTAPTFASAGVTAMTQSMAQTMTQPKMETTVDNSFGGVQGYQPPPGQLGTIPASFNLSHPSYYSSTGSAAMGMVTMTSNPPPSYPSIHHGYQRPPTTVSCMDSIPPTTVVGAFSDDAPPPVVFSTCGLPTGLVARANIVGNLQQPHDSAIVVPLNPISTAAMGGPERNQLPASQPFPLPVDEGRSRLNKTPYDLDQSHHGYPAPIQPIRIETTGMNLQEEPAKTSQFITLSAVPSTSRVEPFSSSQHQLQLTQLSGGSCFDNSGGMMAPTVASIFNEGGQQSTATIGSRKPPVPHNMNTDFSTVGMESTTANNQEPFYSPNNRQMAGQGQLANPRHLSSPGHQGNNPQHLLSPVQHASPSQMVSPGQLAPQGQMASPGQLSAQGIMTASGQLLSPEQLTSPGQLSSPVLGQPQLLAGSHSKVGTASGVGQQHLPGSPGQLATSYPSNYLSHSDHMMAVSGPGRPRPLAAVHGLAASTSGGGMLSSSYLSDSPDDVVKTEMVKSEDEFGGIEMDASMTLDSEDEESNYEESPKKHLNIREELKLRMQQKLKQEMPSMGAMATSEMDDMGLACNIKQEHEELSTEDEERRRRRRERNKIAATKCRNKKKERTSRLISENTVLNQQNINLKQELRRLKSEEDRLTDLLSSHKLKCGKRTQDGRFFSGNSSRPNRSGGGKAGLGQDQANGSQLTTDASGGERHNDSHVQLSSPGLSSSTTTTASKRRSSSTSTQSGNSTNGKRRRAANEVLAVDAQPAVDSSTGASESDVHELPEATRSTLELELQALMPPPPPPGGVLPRPPPPYKDVPGKAMINDCDNNEDDLSFGHGAISTWRDGAKGIGDDDLNTTIGEATQTSYKSVNQWNTTKRDPSRHGGSESSARTPSSGDANQDNSIVAQSNSGSSAGRHQPDPGATKTDLNRPKNELQPAAAAADAKLAGKPKNAGTVVGKGRTTSAVRGEVNSSSNATRGESRYYNLTSLRRSSTASFANSYHPDNRCLAL